MSDKTPPRPARADPPRHGMGPHRRGAHRRRLQGGSGMMELPDLFMERQKRDQARRNATAAQMREVGPPYANSREALDAVYAACATWIFELVDGGGDPAEAMGHVRLMREIEQTIAGYGK